jgi:hypothetical protein
MIDGETSLSHHLFEVAIAERVSEIPSHNRRMISGWK